MKSQFYLGDKQVEITKINDIFISATEAKNYESFPKRFKMKYITKIKLSNFKRFKTFSADFDPHLNILVGDNEAGKSTILQAIHFVLTGSRSLIDASGLDNLFNSDAIREFYTSKRTFADLPVLYIELYLNDFGDFNLNGNVNSTGLICDGLRFECVPDFEFSSQIMEIVSQSNDHFPFEYYTMRFNTFAGHAYSPYKKILRHLLLDSSLTSDDYALRGYVKDMYESNVETAEKYQHLHEYRTRKSQFKDVVLASLNNRLTDYSFSIRNNSKANLETDLTLSEGDIAIEHKGRGKRSFIKTEFALRKSTGNVDVLLLEEPENHLSHTNMQKLIARVSESIGKQLFITTHNSLISARLDLRKTILLNSTSTVPVPLKDLSEPSAKFFMKSPDSNILEFVLSKKNILVEGHAEYMLIRDMYESVCGKEIEKSDTHVISVGGISFKPYLEVAQLLKIRTAVIRDNDGKYQENCVDNYDEYPDNWLQVFADPDNRRTTFEICIYEDNQSLCDTLFSGPRRKLSIQQYMLNNKSEAAFTLLEKSTTAPLTVPSYIKQALLWINE